MGERREEMRVRGRSVKWRLFECALMTRLGETKISAGLAMIRYLISDNRLG